MSNVSGNFFVFLFSCSAAVIEKPNEIDSQPPVNKETDVSDDMKKKTHHPAPSLTPLPSLSSTVCAPVPPKPAPRTIMSAEKVITHTGQETVFINLDFMCIQKVHEKNKQMRQTC